MGWDSVQVTNLDSHSVNVRFRFAFRFGSAQLQIQLKLRDRFRVMSISKPDFCRSSLKMFQWNSTDITKITRTISKGTNSCTKMWDSLRHHDP